MAKAPEPQGLFSLNLDSACSQELVMEPLETAEATKMGKRPSYILNFRLGELWSRRLLVSHLFSMPVAPGGAGVDASHRHQRRRSVAGIFAAENRKTPTSTRCPNSETFPANFYFASSGFCSKAATPPREFITAIGTVLDIVNVTK